MKTIDWCGNYLKGSIGGRETKKGGLGLVQWVKLGGKFTAVLMILSLVLTTTFYPPIEIPSRRGGMSVQTRY